MKLILVIAAFVAITQISLINSANVEGSKSPIAPRSINIESFVQSPRGPGHRRSINEGAIYAGVSGGTDHPGQREVYVHW